MYTYNVSLTSMSLLSIHYIIVVLVCQEVTSTIGAGVAFEQHHGSIVNGDIGSFKGYT